MTLKISITNIKVNTISNIGSFNIGKTILCRNQTTDISGPAPAPPGQAPDISPAQVGPTGLGPAQIRAPGPGQIQVPSVVVSPPVT